MCSTWQINEFTCAPAAGLIIHKVSELVRNSAKNLECSDCKQFLYKEFLFEAR